MLQLLDNKTKVLVQGITSERSRKLTYKMIAGGTNVVGGVEAGRGGIKIEDRPVFDTLEEAVNFSGANTLVLMPGGENVKETISKALELGLKLVITVAEDIPSDEINNLRNQATARGIRFICDRAARLETIFARESVEEVWQGLKEYGS